IVTREQPTLPSGLWRYRVDRNHAIVGGATSEGGNIYAWCRQVLRLGSDEEVEAALAALPPDGHGLTILPHLAGERSPGWRDGRRGAIAGLRLDTSGLDIVRAALESVALRLAAVYRLLAPCASGGHTIAASRAARGHSHAGTQSVLAANEQPHAWSHDPD